MGARPDLPPTAFGLYLIEAMEDHDPPLSRQDLAGLVRVSESTISRWITGPGKPKTEILAVAADALGIDLGELLVRAGHGRPADPETIKQPELAHPLLREVDRMLDPRSPLTDKDRERLLIIIEAGMEGFRSKMRRRRAG